MSFSLVLQRNLSDNHALDKVLEDVATVTGTLKDGTSLMTPTIILEGNPSTWATVNYMSISAFGRMYYVTDIKTLRTGLVEVSGKVDVLTTYNAQIRACTGIVRRQENSWNLYLDDGTFKVYQNPQIQQLTFPGFFDSLTFVLAVAGKPRGF